MSGEFQLNAQQIKKLDEITNGGQANLADGYDYLRAEMQKYLDNPDNAGRSERRAYENTAYWLTKAVEINRNDPDSEANLFIRGVTRNGLLFDGKEASPEKVQQNSDIIAKSVLADTFVTKQIPAIANLLAYDVNAALDKGGQTLGGWGGAFYYWDMPLSAEPGDTVGSRILNNPVDYEKFLGVTAKAVLDTISKRGVSVEQLWTSMGAQAPEEIKASLFNRVADYLDGSSVSLLGNPNEIDGYRASIGPDGKVSWYTQDSPGKRSNLTDVATIAKLNTRRDIRSNHGEIHPWQMPMKDVQTIRLGDGTTYKHTYNDEGRIKRVDIDRADGTKIERLYDARERLSSETTFLTDRTARRTLYDHENKQSWSEATTTYDPNGRAIAQNVRNDNGTRYEAVVDAATGRYTQRSDFITAGQKTATTAFGPDGSIRSKTTFDAMGRQGWTEVTHGYNGNGGIVSEKRLNKDGTRSEAVVDPATGSFKQRSDFNTAGQKTATTAFGPDGNIRSKTTFDATGRQGWTEVTHGYNGNGGIVSERHLNKDGTRSEAVVNPATSRITQRTEYNKANQKVQITDFRADGTGRNTLYDVDNSHGWREVKIDYDAQGKPTREAGVNDNGTRYEADVNPSTGRFTNRSDFDTTGMKTATTTFRDDGTRRVTHHNLKNSGPWTEAAVEYARQGQAVSETGTNRYGDRYEAMLDPATGKFTERSDYNAAGQKVSAITYRPDGSGQKTLYDVAGNQPWSEVTTLLDKNGKPTAEWGRNDDGTHFDATVNPDTGKYIVRNDYNKEGQREVSTTFRDDGTQKKVFTDPANNKPYSEVAIEYDRLGHAVAEAGRLDNGDQYQAIYKYGSLSEEAVILVSDGLVINKSYIAGTLTDMVLRDNHNKYDWTSKKITYRGKSPDQEITIMDDGKVYNVYYHNDGSFNFGNVTMPSGAIYYLKNNGGRLTYKIPSQGPSGGFGAALASFAMGLVPSYGSRTITLNGGGSSSGNGTLLSGNSYSGGSTGGGTGGYDPNFGLAPLSSWNTGGGGRGGKPSGISIGLPNTGQWSGAHNPLVPPVVLDLNGDGELDIRPLGQNTVTGTDVSFDWDGDGIANQSAWVGPEDGLLVIDLAADGTAGADGRIDQAREVAFALWKTEDERQAELRQKGIDDTGRPVTDMEGLRYAFDTNGDNILDSRDARFNEFRIWQDMNQNGIADDGELRTLSEAGIRLIELLPSYNGAKSFHDGSAITGTGKALKADGTSMLVGDVTLSYRPAVSL
ncbi:hypothetical protein [Ochrobactrum quorumnocens]|uniref:Uncharacterized protein n=1 Tax=Ochrobactrum quorumnocens TaxID=271865 RepID=A0A5N1JPC6_9HYPH|nr:hypothetical protein [[Ochrobactrum] quorumnocens]KAA9361437.1 hypothetical protein F3W84_20275 [[Ochrobactrum] quorumnocens]